MPVRPDPRGRVRWELLTMRKSTQRCGARSSKATELAGKLTKAARSKTGLVPNSPVEALVFLDYTKENALDPLKAIFVAQGLPDAKAEQTAKSQIALLWDMAVKRKATLEKYKVEANKRQ